MHDLSSLLGRWHQWRRSWSHERAFARSPLPVGEPDEEDELERLLIEAIEREIAKMPQDLQIALQHVARAECMGVEVIFNPRMGNKDQRELLVERAVETLNRRLLQAGVF